MKKINIILILLFMTTNIFTMNEPKTKLDFDKISYATTKLAIEALKETAKVGDSEAAVALEDFYKSLEDPNYKITLKSSQDKLTGISVLHVDKKSVDDRIRKLMEKYEKIS